MYGMVNKAVSIHLHYYSNRAGLQPFVVGLVGGLADLFATGATGTVLRSRNTGADHKEFLAEWSNDSAAMQ